MNFVSIILLTIYGYFLSVRILRWASIWQQKEYRTDRMIAWLQTKEGLSELKKLATFPRSKAEIRRPKLTIKMILILSCTLMLLYGNGRQSEWQLLLLYLSTPVFILIATIPAWGLTAIVLKVIEVKARYMLHQVNPDIIGVGGSYGKTTTKILVGTLLQQRHSVWVSPKSHNTPLSIAQAIVKTYRRQEIMVMEYASYKLGEISYLTSIYPPNKGIFTGLNDQHLALFGSHDKMLQAETELYDSLVDGAIVYYNDSDPLVNQEIKRYHQLTSKPASAVKLDQVQLNAQGYLSFKLSESVQTVKTYLIGRHYLNNLKLAIQIARDYNVSDQLIAQALTNFEPGEEFIRRQKGKRGNTIIIDDRTSNPDGFVAAIELLGELEGKHKIIISAGIIDLADQEDPVHFSISQKSFPIIETFLHTSITGNQALASGLGDKYQLITKPGQLHKILNSLKNTTILVEGKINPIYYQILKEAV